MFAAERVGRKRRKRIQRRNTLQSNLYKVGVMCTKVPNCQFSS